MNPPKSSLEITSFKLPYHNLHTRLPILYIHEFTVTLQQLASVAQLVRALSTRITGPWVRFLPEDLVNSAFFAIAPG